MATFGLGFGAFVALSILLAHLAASKFSNENPWLDLVVRLGTFGVLVLVASEVIGSYYGPQIRKQAPWFWGGFAVGFVLFPSLVSLCVRFLYRKSVANSVENNPDSN